MLRLLMRLLSLLVVLGSEVSSACDSDKNLRAGLSHSEEAAHRVWERRYWFFSAFWSVAIVVGAFISAYIAYRQLTDQQRAWVYIEDKLDLGDLDWQSTYEQGNSEQIGRVEVSFSLHNLGQTPARLLWAYADVIFASRLSLVANGGNGAPSTKDQCKSQEGQRKSALLTGLFPTEDRRFNHRTATLRQADFKRAAGASIFAKVDTYVLICVSYVNVEDGDNSVPHYSAKLFKLQKRTVPQKIVTLESIPFGMALAADDLAVDPADWGDTSD